jgi:hypothetical protein
MKAFSCSDAMHNAIQLADQESRRVGESHRSHQSRYCYHSTNDLDTNLGKLQ